MFYQQLCSTNGSNRHLSRKKTQKYDSVIIYLLIESKWKQLYIVWTKTKSGKYWPYFSIDNFCLEWSYFERHPDILNTCLVKQIFQTVVESSDLWQNYMNVTLFEWNVTYVTLRLVDRFGIFNLNMIYVFAPISINISNSIPYTVVSINISVLFDKTFCWSAIKHGHAWTMQF